MARYGTGRAGLLVGTGVVTLALLAAAASPAAAADPPRLSVSTLGPTSVSLLATGFAPGTTVDVTVTVGGCAGHRSVVAGAAGMPVEFVTVPPCTGRATAVADAGPQSAGTGFVFGDPGGAPPNGATARGEATADPPGRRPVTSTCTLHATGGRVPAAKPGDTVCFTGTLPARLDIRAGGTASAPVTYSGMGTATVPGITVRASNVVLEGFVSKGAKDNGIYVSGNDITVQDNDISQVSITDDDVDAMRFFGDRITIAHNDSHDIWANPQAGGAPHTDCMQTYAHNEPASSNVRIEANRCASPQFHQCLMAEGPHDVDSHGSGIGHSANWLVAGNYFECHAQAQTVALQDIQNVTFTANDFAGTGARAIALQKDATGATVAADNVKGPGYRELVGIDDPSARQGYRGPAD